MSETYHQHRALYANAAGDKKAEQESLDELQRIALLKRYQNTDWGRVDKFMLAFEKWGVIAGALVAAITLGLACVGIYKLLDLCL